MTHTAMKSCTVCNASFHPLKQQQKLCKPRCKGIPKFKACKRCGNQFSVGFGLKAIVYKLYCSRKCSRLHYMELNRKVSYYPGLSTASVGCIAELRVSVELLAKGYEVFRALSASCSCDLAILKDGQLRRIEVRTAYPNKNGKAQACRKNKSDHLALVMADKIVYEPPIENYPALVLADLDSASHTS